MTIESKNGVRITVGKIMIEALKGIKSEILLYGIIVLALFISSASLGIEVLRELKWPIFILATLVLIFYFMLRALPRAKKEVIKRSN